MLSREELVIELTQGIRGTKRINGHHVVARNARSKAICLGDNVTSQVLREMFEETTALGLERPIHVYGSTCTVGETESFHFHQIATI